MNAESRQIPVDACRRGNVFKIHFDLPGVVSRFVELIVEQDLLTVRATGARVRTEVDQIQIPERSDCEFSTQLFLGESLDRDHIAATYENGVLTPHHPRRRRGQVRQGRDHPRRRRR